MYSIYTEYSGRLAQQTKITQPDHGLHFLPICDYIHILHISKGCLLFPLFQFLINLQDRWKPQVESRLHGDFENV